MYNLLGKIDTKLPSLALMTKFNFLQTQSVASNFFLTMAPNSGEPNGFVYSCCTSRQDHVAEKSLVRLEKREGCKFSEVHSILSKAKDMT